MIRFLYGVILAEVAVGLLAGVLYLGSEGYLAARYRLDALAAEEERAACELKHAQLIKQIKKEGLWRRLGMPGQPWLH